MNVLHELHDYLSGWAQRARSAGMFGDVLQAEVAGDIVTDAEKSVARLAREAFAARLDGAIYYLEKQLQEKNSTHLTFTK